jgi:mannosyltransferase OCH1-like enzyme
LLLGAEYLQVYKDLPKAVERADFFRYLVILRHGGMYADSDVECMMPIEQWKDVCALASSALCGSRVVVAPSLSG